MGLFDIFDEDFRAGLKFGRRLRSDPNFAKQYYANQTAQQMSPLADFIYGHQSNPGEYAGQAGNTKFGAMDMNVGNPMQNQPTPVVPPQEATGMFDESVPMDQRHMLMNKRMLSSGIPGFLDQWAKNQAAMQDKQVMGAIKPTTMMQNVMAAGHGPYGSPSHQARMEQQLQKPGMTINTGKVAEPLSTTDIGKWEVPDNKGGWQPPTPGMSMSDIGRVGGRLKAGISGENSGKAAMLGTSQQELPILRSLLFGDDGKVNRKTLWGASLEAADPTNGVIARGLGFTTPQSEQLASGFERGIQAITRIETGAAMPADEVRNTRRRFMPISGESDAVIQMKMNAYEYFINNATKLINPDGIDVGNLTDKQRANMVNQGIDKAMQAVSSEYRLPGPTGADHSKYEYRQKPDGTWQRKLK